MQIGKATQHLLQNARQLVVAQALVAGHVVGQTAVHHQLILEGHVVGVVGAEDGALDRLQNILVTDPTAADEPSFKAKRLARRGGERLHLQGKVLVVTHGSGLVDLALETSVERLAKGVLFHRLQAAFKLKEQLIDEGKGMHSARLTLAANLRQQQQLVVAQIHLGHQVLIAGWKENLGQADVQLIKLLV